MCTVLHLLALFLALAPAVALLAYIRHLDKYEPEPWNVMGRAFLFGCLSVIPAIIIELLWGLVLPSEGFVGTIWTAFVLASLTEEFCKGGMAYWAVWKKPEFNEVMDGVVYFGVAHMGFAVTENLKYVFMNGGNIYQGLMNAFARTTTAVPLHVICGMIMGYHMGQAKHGPEKERTSHYIQAFAIPILLHGFYDLGAFNQIGTIRTVDDLMRNGFGSALLYAAVVALWLFMLPRVKQAQLASPFRPQAAVALLQVAPVSCGSCGAGYPVEANYCHRCGAPVTDQVAAAQGE